MYKEVALTKGKVALVSREDYAYLTQWDWKYSESTGYGVYYLHSDAGKGTLFMHRVTMAHILGHPIPRGYVVDHRDHDRLNQQRSNLRLASPSQNSWNTGMRGNSSTGLKGVRFNKGKHEVNVRVYYQRIYLGRYVEAYEAGLVYDAAARILFGEFANLNYPEILTPPELQAKVMSILSKHTL